MSSIFKNIPILAKEITMIQEMISAITETILNLMPKDKILFSLFLLNIWLLSNKD